MLGAFGAHALKTRLDGEALSVWQTAVQYHFWHALALLATPRLASVWAKAAGWLFVAGVLAFSGSLYALALGAPHALGMVTPLGGLALILGWLAFAVAAIRA
ncbi:MAG TPA: DUF423 domain-containing protein [Burkholderiales bacterium]|nr:DUF423 domain-containing protein [Burkholderiales bacterium]